MIRKNSVTVTRSELVTAGHGMLEMVRERLLDAGCPLAVNGEVATFDQREVRQLWSIDGEVLTFEWEVIDNDA
jgi:hypothetical protein